MTGQYATPKKTRKSQVYPQKWAESEEIFLQEKDLSKSVMILEGKKTVPETESDLCRILSGA